MTGTGRTIFGCSGLDLTTDESAFFQEARPWGFILFARNIDRPEQVRRLTSDLRDAVGYDAPVLIDQEGGRVARMRMPHWREWLPPLDQVARMGNNAGRSMYLRYRIIADELHKVGIDCNCAPCADLATAETHPILRNRCYAEDPQTVVSIAREVAQGLLDGGVMPVVKHMPGHGRATLDSHLELPRVEVPEDTLWKTDFACFAGVSDLPLGMSAHIVFEGLGETGPATTSARMVDLIRNEIGFGGLLMTDDLSMQALSGTVRERSRNALDAGIDIILHCNGELSQMEDVAEEAGDLDGAAKQRADLALTYRKSPNTVDIDALEAEFQALMRNNVNG